MNFISNKKKTLTLFLLIALLPALVHTIFFLIYYSKININIIDYSKPYYFDEYDIFIFILFSVYLLSMIISLINLKYIISHTIISYITILSIISFELIAGLLYPPQYYIWNPMYKRLLYPAENVIPGFSGKVEFSVNQYGLRGPVVNLNKADIKILTVGGSSTECLYVTDKQSWPWRLQHSLSKHLKKNIFVGNAGKSGHFTLNHNYFLQKYKFTPLFNWVIVLCGINDIERVTLRDYEVRKKFVPSSTFINSKCEDTDLIYYKKTRLFHKLKLFYDIYISKITEVQDNAGKWYEKRRKLRQKCLKRKTINYMPDNLYEGLKIYKRNLMKIIKTCRKNKQNLLMLTQPTLWRKDLPPELEKLLWVRLDRDGACSAEILAEIISLINEATIKVCKQEGVYCIDLASLLPKDESVFYDDCHFNINGCRLVAAVLNDFFVNYYSEGNIRK